MLKRKLHSVLSFVPISISILFLYCLINATVQLGRLPQEGDMGAAYTSQALFDFVAFSTLAVYIPILIWILMYVLNQNPKEYFLGRRAIAVFIFGAILQLYFFIFNPFTLRDWLFD